VREAWVKDLGRVMGSIFDFGVISFESKERSGLRPKTRQWPGSIGMRMGGFLFEFCLLEAWMAAEEEGLEGGFESEMFEMI